MSGESKTSAEEKFQPFEGKTILDVLPHLTQIPTAYPHQAPCPAQTATRIEEDQAVNEWVLNHLPLTEEQKQQLRQDLVVEKTIADRTGKLESARKKLQAAKDKRLKGERIGVKDLTKIPA
jgi:hypothetical protein